MAHNIEFLLSVFDSLRLGIIVVDLEGKVRMSNKIAQVMSGRAILPHNYVWQIFRESVLARDIQYAIEHDEDFDFREYTLMAYGHADAAHAVDGAYAMAMKTVRCALLPLVEQKSERVLVNAEVYDEHDKDSFAPLSVKRSPITQNVVTGSIVCLEDVSAEREVEQKAYRDKSFMSMKHITAGIAHEIKNPLSAISLHLALLRRKIQNAEKTLKSEKGKTSVLKYLDIIEDEIQTMDKIVSVFLNDFKIQSSELEPKDMGQLLSDVLKFVALDLKQRGVKVVKKLQNAVLMVFISTPAMTHVLLNLIKNAMEAMDSGGELRIAMDYSDGKVHVVISDTGAGVSAELHKHIFDPYFTTKSTGSGIGLTIAYKLVRLHGGNLELNTSYTQGASFVVSLPAYADEQRLLSNE